MDNEGQIGRMSRILGGVVLGLITLGVLINLKDLKRYVRMSTM